MPVYNGKRFLCHAIDSCLAQTYQNVEVIVVDDCSTDGSAEIIKSYKDARVSYIKHEKNTGLPAALNTGFSNATGDLLTWTSDDNEYYPTAIENMVDCLQKQPQVEFVYADYLAVWEDENRSQKIQLPEKLNINVKNQVGACFLYTRKVYDQIGEFNVNYSLIEDYDYWIRVWLKFQMRHCQKELYMYRFHGSSLTITKLYQVKILDIFLRHEHGFLNRANVKISLSSLLEEMAQNSPQKETIACLKESLLRIQKISFYNTIIFALFTASIYLFLPFHKTYKNNPRLRKTINVLLWYRKKLWLIFKSQTT